MPSGLRKAKMRESWEHSTFREKRNYGCNCTEFATSLGEVCCSFGLQWPPLPCQFERRRGHGKVAEKSQCLSVSHVLINCPCTISKFRMVYFILLNFIKIFGNKCFLEHEDMYENSTLSLSGIRDVCKRKVHKIQFFFVLLKIMC